VSGCNGLCGRLAARMHSGGWEPPHYKRLKPKLLGALEGEVIEIGSGVNLEYYRDNVKWTGIKPNTFLHERIRRRAAGIAIPPDWWPEERNASTCPMEALRRWSARSSCVRWEIRPEHWPSW
jgi:hypothetical protein